MLTTGVTADCIAGGVPALVTSWPYLAESLGNAGLPMGDDREAWTAAVDALSPERVARAAEATRALRTRHDWAVVAEQHLELLEAVGSAKH
jgi:glycosyltransferase involved in cell wall biosynthesis